jgi:hypothetical protein
MSYDKKTIEINDTYSIVIEEIYDDSGFPQRTAEEQLGSYGDKPGLWHIDTRNGWLLGDEEEEPEYKEDDVPEHPRPSKKLIHPERYFHSTAAYEYEYDLFKNEIREWNKLWVEYKKKVNEYDKLYEDWENRHGRKILADVRCSYDRNSYQFFHPEYSKYMECEEKLTELTPEQIADIEKQYNRMVEFNQGWWGYIGIEVTLIVSGDEIKQASLWGIESDCKEYHKEVIEELLAEVTSDIGLEIDDEISHLKLKIQELEEVKQDIPTEEEIKEKVLAEI